MLQQPVYTPTFKKSPEILSITALIPADDKLNARLIISRIVLETLNGLKLSHPKPDAKRLKELQSFRKQLVK